MITGAPFHQYRGETSTLPLFEKRTLNAQRPTPNAEIEEKRDAALQEVTAHAEREDIMFLQRARKFVLFYLSRCGEASSEEITDAAKANGIRPPDDRAFGPVYLSLSRRGLIVKSGFCLRKKGHLTGGGNLWRLTK